MSLQPFSFSMIHPMPPSNLAAEGRKLYNPLECRMKAVVTGCAGFIGSHLCEALLGEGREVVGIDCLDPYYGPDEKRRNLELLERRAGFSFRPEDILDPSTALAYPDADSVFHMAATPGVRSSIGKGHAYAMNNVVGTQSVLDKASRGGVGKVIVASSSSVYGDVPAPTPESGPTRPISPYGAAKLAAEKMCDAHAICEPNLAIVSLRFFCVYGPRCRPDLVLSKFAKLMLDGRPVPVYGDMDALSRDYTYIDDIVAGILAAEAAAAPGHEVYNLGNGSPVTLREAISAMAVAFGVEPEFDLMPGNPADARTTHADTGKAERDLGWRAATSYADGVARYAEWLSSS